MTRYTYTTCLSFGTDGEADYCELDATISYVVHPGRPETPPAFHHGGLQAEAAEIDDIRVEKIDWRPVGAGDEDARDAILAKFDTGEHDADLLAEAAEQDAIDADGWADHMRSMVEDFPEERW